MQFVWKEVKFDSNLYTFCMLYKFYTKPIWILYKSPYECLYECPYESPYKSPYKCLYKWPYECPKILYYIYTFFILTHFFYSKLVSKKTPCSYLFNPLSTQPLSEKYVFYLHKFYLIQRYSLFPFCRQNSLFQEKEDFVYV